MFILTVVEDTKNKVPIGEGEVNTSGRGTLDMAFK